MLSMVPEELSSTRPSLMLLVTARNSSFFCFSSRAWPFSCRCWLSIRRSRGESSSKPSLFSGSSRFSSFKGLTTVFDTLEASARARITATRDTNSTGCIKPSMMVSTLFRVMARRITEPSSRRWAE